MSESENGKTIQMHHVKKGNETQTEKKIAHVLRIEIPKSSSRFKATVLCDLRLEEMHLSMLRQKQTSFVLNTHDQ